MKISPLFKSLLFTVSAVFFSLSAQAAIEEPSGPFDGVPCLDGNTAICVQEISTGALEGQYQITNGTPNQIFAFGVTNEIGRAYSFERGWSGQAFSDESWNMGRVISFADDSTTRLTWITGGTAGATNDDGFIELGSFESLFGNEENNVNFYWNSTLTNSGSPISNLTNNVTLNQFYFGGKPNSNFAAFGENALTLASSVSEQTTTVPEPESYAMFLAGLGLLGFASRRKPT